MQSVYLSSFKLWLFYKRTINGYQRLQSIKPNTFPARIFLRELQVIIHFLKYKIRCGCFFELIFRDTVVCSDEERTLDVPGGKPRIASTSVVRKYHSKFLYIATLFSFVLSLIVFCPYWMVTQMKNKRFFLFKYLRNTLSIIVIFIQQNLNLILRNWMNTICFYIGLYKRPLVLGLQPWLFHKTTCLQLNTGQGYLS